MDPDQISFYDCTEDGKWVFSGPSRKTKRAAVYDAKTQHWYWYNRTAGEVYRMLKNGTSLEEIDGPDYNYSRICVAFDLYRIKEMYDWLVGGEAQLA